MIAQRLLIISLVLFICPAVLAMDVDLWNLPAPGDAEVIYQDKEIQINGISAQSTHLSSKLNTQELFDFYQSAFLKNGWQIKDNFKEQNIIVFTKADRFFYIGVHESGKDFPRDVYLVSSPKDLALCRMLDSYFLKQTIAEDSPGKDLLDIPRFPGAKRRVNLAAPDQGNIIMYEAEANVSTIAQFYRSALKENGWRVSPGLDMPRIKKLSPEAKDIEILLYEKKGANIIMNIFPAEQEGVKRSLIVITRNIEEIISTGGSR